MSLEFEILAGIALVLLIASVVLVLASNNIRRESLALRDGRERTAQQLASIESRLAPFQHAFSPNSLQTQWAELPFHQAVKLEPLLDRMRLDYHEITRSRILRGLRQVLPQGANLTANMISLTFNEGGFVVKFSDVPALSGQEFVMEKGLPYLRELSGKMTQLTRQSLGEKEINILTSLASIGASAANLIAGFDNAKKLKSIVRDVRILAANRKTAQLTKLENTYIRCQRLLSGPLLNSQLNEVREIVNAIREARADLRLDYASRLEAVEGPQGLDNLLRFVGRSERSDKKIEAQFLSSQENLALQQFALLFQIAVEQWLGSEDLFIKFDVPFEIAKLEEIETLFEYKRKNFLGDPDRIEISKLKADLTQTLDFVRGFV
jgi:hypothetical protein